MAKVLRACERALLWDEAVYLYKEDGQYDSAVKTMIDHCVCFQHDLFLDCVNKVRRAGGLRQWSGNGLGPTFFFFFPEWLVVFVLDYFGWRC